MYNESQDLKVYAESRFQAYKVGRRLARTVELLGTKARDAAGQR